MIHHYLIELFIQRSCFSPSLSLSLMSCVLNEECEWVCVFMITAFSASVWIDQVIIVQRWARAPQRFYWKWNLWIYFTSFIFSDRCFDLPQQHKNTSWLFYWTFGRCWTDWLSECSSQTVGAVSPTHHRKQAKQIRFWRWLSVNHTWMISSGLLFSHRVTARCKAPTELQHQVSTSI